MVATAAPETPSDPPRYRSQNRWPPAIREAAERIGDDLNGHAPEVQRRLKAEHGADVPLATVARWVQLRPSRRAPTPGDLKQRTIHLLSQEIERLERSSPQKRDLTRLSQVAQILKTLDGLKASRTDPNQKTLKDLSPSEPTDAERVPFKDLSGLGAVPDPASDPGR